MLSSLILFLMIYELFYVFWAFFIFAMFVCFSMFLLISCLGSLAGIISFKIVFIIKTYIPSSVSKTYPKRKYRHWDQNSIVAVKWP